MIPLFGDPMAGGKRFVLEGWPDNPDTDERLVCRACRDNEGVAVPEYIYAEM
jgi:hypothetical protein